MKVNWNERVNAIIEVCKDWAFVTSKGDYLISFWELAFNLNNSWYANLFVETNYLIKNGRKYHNKIALENYSLHHFRRRIRSTIRMMHGNIIKQGFNEFYLISGFGIEIIEKRKNGSFNG